MLRALYMQGVQAAESGDAVTARPLFYRLLSEASRLGDLHHSNLALNEIEMLDGALRLYSKPRGMHVMLTARCNMACPFCYAEHMGDEDLPPEVCRELKGLFPYLQRVVWQGGEACLHPEFEDLIKESAKHRHMGQTLVTNGLFLSERWMDLFAETAKFDLMLPVESMRPELHGRYRPGSSWAKLAEKVRMISEYRERRNPKLSLSMNVVLMKGNHRELPAIVDFAAENGFSAMVLTGLYQCSDGFYRQEHLSFAEAREYLDGVMPSVRAKLEKSGISLQDRFSPPAAPSADGAADGRKPTVRCRAPWQQLYILPDGRTRSYCYCQEDIGNLKSETPELLWNNARAMALRKSMLEGRSSRCHQACVEGRVESYNFRMI